MWGGSKVWGEVGEMWGEMWAVGEGKKYKGCREVWRKEVGGDVQGEGKCGER